MQASTMPRPTPRIMLKHTERSRTLFHMASSPTECMELALLPQLSLRRPSSAHLQTRRVGTLRETVTAHTQIVLSWALLRVLRHIGWTDI
jgi:hypothetical protein